MKKISELILDDGFRYTEDHEWAAAEGNVVKAGVSDYAQDQLGDIVYVELPQIGDRFDAGEEFGTVESVKAVSELCMPVGGEIVDINSDLEDSPELVNEDSGGDGWMIRFRPDDWTDLESLMSKEQYLEMLRGSLE